MNERKVKDSYNVLRKALIAMFIFDGLFTWLTISIYSFHVLELGFSAFFLALAYTSGEICRIVVAIWSKSYTWYIPIIVMIIASVMTIPAIIDDTTQFSMFCLALQKSGELYPLNLVQIGFLVKKKRDNVIDTQYRCQTLTSVCTGSWVLGYSVGSLICGLVYEFWSIRPLLIIQFFGFVATALLHLFLKLNNYSFQVQHSNAVATNNHKKQQEPEKNNGYSTVLWTFVLLPMFFQGVPIAIFMVFVKLYQSRFGIGPTISCLVQMIGDVLGSLWCIAKGHLRTIYKKKQRSEKNDGLMSKLAYGVKQISRVWFFRSPRDVSFTLLSVGIATCMMCSNNLGVVIIGHIATGALYVFLTRSAATGLLIYCQDPRYATHSNDGIHRVLSSYQMTATVVIKVVTSFVSPFILDKDLNLALLSNGSLALIGSFIVAVVFLLRIKNRFKDQSYTRLSKSVYKLEAELWDSEMKCHTESKVTSPSPPKLNKTKLLVEIIDGTFTSDEEEDDKNSGDINDGDKEGDAT